MVGLTLTRAVYIRIAYMQPTIAGSRVADHRCFLGMVQKQVTAQGWLMSTPEGDAPDPTLTRWGLAGCRQLDPQPSRSCYSRRSAC